MHEAAIEINSLKLRFGETVVHDGVTFNVPRGNICAVIGGSGAGKSVLLKQVIGLQRPDSGQVRLLGKDVWGSSEDELSELRQRFGVLFQNSALFSALTAAENVAVPLVEQTKLPADLIAAIVQLRLALTGLPEGTGQKMPSELSGGMKKRVALARALALEPDIVFLDEPASGLDPINARGFDHLIRTLSDSLGLTIFMVTHDLDSILGIADQVVVLDKGKVIADGPVKEVVKKNHPWIQEYFSSRISEGRISER